MFKAFLKFFTTTCLLYIHAYSTEGLQCYRCYYLRGAPLDKDFTMGDPSCEFGKQLHRSLSLDCDTLKIGTNATGKTFSCLTVKLNGQFKSGSKAKGSFTTRTCLLHPPESESRLARKSYYNSSFEIETLLQLAKGRRIFFDFLVDFKDSAEAEAWTCDGNNCNGLEQARALVGKYDRESASVDQNIGEDAFIEQDANRAVFRATPSKPLSCYLCTSNEKYERPDAKEMRLDTSCAAGNEPKPEFSTNCGDLDYFGNATHGIFIGVPKGLGGSGTVNLTNIYTKSKAIYSCITFFVDKESTDLRQSTKKSARFCAIFSGANELDKCYEEDVSQLHEVIEEPWLKSWTGTFLDQYSADTKIRICSCFTDDCNGAKRSSSAAIHSKVLQIIFGMYYLFFNL